KIVADEKIESLAEVVQDSRRFTAKICGPQREVMNALRSVQGVTRVEVTGERELDSYTYIIEAAPGVDIRKPLFFEMSKQGKPIIGLEAAQMNLEEIFIRIMDKSEEGGRK
ncbi:MAG: ABC transporter, partial [Oscillospiraceae bacterium]|nr:ABC transporter [Oscillospiraceae bacterium]